jgi:hypothetical protein
MKPDSHGAFWPLVSLLAQPEGIRFSEHLAGDGRRCFDTRANLSSKRPP